MTSPIPVKGLFIAGSNTEVGKTTVMCAIARSLVRAGWRVGVYKPAASGAVRRDGQLVSEDAELLWEAAGRPQTLAEVCPQVFEAPLAPHLAASAEGKRLDAQLLCAGAEAWPADQWDVLLVEGAGGLLSPIHDELLVADLALDLGYPVLLVVPNTLGVIGQTLQTLLAAQAYRPNLPACIRHRQSATTASDPLRIAGIVANQVQPPSQDDSVTSNLTQLRKWCAAPILGELLYDGQAVMPEVEWGQVIGERR